MIIDDFTKLFRKKSEDSLQKTAEESRIKRDAETATEEFNDAGKSLKNFLHEIKSDKKNHG